MQNPGPWDPVENSRLFAQRTVRPPQTPPPPPPPSNTFLTLGQHVWHRASHLHIIYTLQ